MGLDPAITAGAVISGAYFGDATSPISSAPTLAAAAGGAPLYDTVRATAPITLVALVIALGVFWWMGGIGELVDGGDGGVGEDLIAIDRFFNISPVLLLPLAIVAGLAVIQMPPFTALFVGAIAGGVLAPFVAPERVIAFATAGGEIPNWLALLKGVWLALASGYTSTTGDPVLDQLASRGGMESMLDTIWLIIVALAFGGVIEKVGVLERLITPIVAAAKSVGTLVTSVVVAVIGTNVATADQYLSIVLPARMFKSAFRERGLGPVALSRTVGTCGTPTSALIPWNSCGAFMAQTLGVATLSYAPYAVFNLACPLLVIAFAYARIGMRVPTAERSGPDSINEPDIHVRS
jgi:NhaC family Na+:H+ antiporter